VHCREAFTKHKASLRNFRHVADGDEDVESMEDEWMVDSRTALRDFVDEAEERINIVSLDPDDWDDEDAP